MRKRGGEAQSDTFPDTFLDTFLSDVQLEPPHSSTERNSCASALPLASAVGLSVGSRAYTSFPLAVLLNFGFLCCVIGRASGVGIPHGPLEGREDGGKGE